MKKSLIFNNLCIIFIFILFLCVAIFYPCKGYFSCDKLQNSCKYKRVSVFNKEYIKTAKLSSLSNSQYTSFSSRMRHDSLMYLIDTDKERDNNIFVQFNFPTLHEAKNVGIKFNNYLNSGENEFKYVDMGLTKTFRNIMIFLFVCLLISIGNFYFNPQNN